jgi:hypothetical protein
MAACESCHGTGCAEGSKNVNCRRCGGRGQVGVSQGFFTGMHTCPECEGRGVVPEKKCSSCGGKGQTQVKRKVSIHIPPGVDTGNRLRVAGEGEPGLRGGQNGDLYVEIEVQEGSLLNFDTIGSTIGYEVYQVATLGGVRYASKANGKVFKILESGTAEIDCFVYPESINDKTPDSYEFELSLDALEIMPYGIAADLLKSDVSAGYGNIYAKRYEDMIARLDPRNHINSMSIEGGVNV